MGSMRQIVVFNHVSADGYFSGSDGKLDWVVQDPAVQQMAGEGMAEIDAILFGRRTYEMFESFWPTAVSDAPNAPDPHHGGRQSPETRAMGVWLNDTSKFVFSKTRKDLTWKNSHLLHDLDPRQVEAMKRQPGKDMIMFGSGSIVSQLTEHGLIDEYRFVVSPIFLGSGQLMIRGLPKHVRVNLLDAKALESGNVMLRYAPQK
jgi:dihydrofolate reductase